MWRWMTMVVLAVCATLEGQNATLNMITNAPTGVVTVNFVGPCSSTGNPSLGQMIISMDGSVNDACQTTQLPGLVVGMAQGQPGNENGATIELNNPGSIAGPGMRADITWRGRGLARAGLVFDRQGVGNNDFSIRDQRQGHSRIYVNNNPQSPLLPYVTIGGPDAEGGTEGVRVDGAGHVRMPYAVWTCRLNAGQCVVLFAQRYSRIPICFGNEMNAGFSASALTMAARPDRLIVMSSNPGDSTAAAGACFGN